MADKLTPEEQAIVDEAEAQADAKATAAEAAADAAGEIASLASKPMVPLNQPLEDALGRKLPKGDPDKAKAMQREAHQIKTSRVEVDVARTQRGLAPKYAKV